MGNKKELGQNRKNFQDPPGFLTRTGNPLASPYLTTLRTDCENSRRVRQNADVKNLGH